ncbi:J domain-containing protein [Paenibacillus xanthanilyticus]|uniref:DnaJ domain-containing protein n=1 Tax=Paenibacillus xanthanilyticus TaxID=1783531 RepID=A0ABV8KC75_9BACL
MYSTDLSAIETEIQSYLAVITQADRATGSAALEIGSRLAHVKEHGMVHGDWLAWLYRVGIEKGYAQRCIRAAANFANNPRAPYLTATQLFELNALPSSVDRLAFLSTEQTVPSTGELKLVEDMKRDEIREVVRAERQRAGITRAAKSVRKAAPATPYINTVVSALQNLSNESAELLETGEITFEQAVQIGRDLNAEQQAILAEIVAEEFETLPELDYVIALVANGVRAETLRDLCELEYELADMEREAADSPILRAEVNRCIEEELPMLLCDNPTDSELKEALLSIRTRLARLKASAEEERRQANRSRKEVERKQATFGSMFTQQLRELGLAVGASFEEIRCSYRTLAKHLHPDVNGGRDDEFKRVKAAYDELHDFYNTWREPLHI